MRGVPDYQADRVILEISDWPLTELLERLEGLGTETADDLIQSISDTWKFCLNTQREIMDAAEETPDGAQALVNRLNGDAPADSLVLWQGIYNQPPSKIQMIRVAHDTALSGLAHLSAAAAALIRDAGR